MKPSLRGSAKQSYINIFKNLKFVYFMEFKELKDRKILVTGGAGFVGSNLSAMILKNGGQVVCFDDLSTGSERNITDLKANPNYKFIKGDANNFDDLKKVFADNKFDYVFHYAARVGVIRTIERPLEVLEDIQGIRHILEFSKDNGVKKVMFS